MIQDIQWEPTQETHTETEINKLSSLEAVCDQFAALAMQAILNRAEDSIQNLTSPSSGTVADLIAENAYFMADAMLAARSNCDQM